MDLLTPGTGLIFWQAVIFLGLFILLAKMAWKPILSSLKERETSIQQALDAAEKAKQEMASLKSDNEKLLKETREERDKILKEAREASNRMKETAQLDARKNAERLIDDAREAINNEKEAALKEVKIQVAMFSIQVAEKLIRKNLSSDKAQKELVEDYIKDLKIN
jgi:F-type H+-transporting ATPase subunit b